MSSEFYIGQRLSFTSALCTIKYIGSVQGTKGAWLGVEWDDPSRGKHSGKHNDVTYFECNSTEPTAGSFVRPSRPHDAEASFLEALYKKYGLEEIRGLAKSNKARPGPSDIEIGGKLVEEVGFEKIRQQLGRLNELKIVLLDGAGISGITRHPRERDIAGQERELVKIGNTCPKTVELDLSRNLIERWEEVTQICRVLPDLKSLKVNGNRFSDLELDRSPAHHLPNIKELGLDECLLSWPDICWLSTHFPSLTSLSASSNMISTIANPINLAYLNTLTLERAGFEFLSDLAPLSRLQTLQSIHLRANKIHATARSSTAVITPFPQSLAYVDFSYNAIPDWSFIDSLNGVFPGLTSLRVSHNPLYEAGMGLGVEEGYMLTLARLPTLQVLNFSSITPADRLNAELYYLSLIARLLSSSPTPASTATILTSHPRYPSLCTTHGAPPITSPSKDTASKIDPNSVEARLITFTFYVAPSNASTANTTNTNNNTNSDEKADKPSTRTIQIPKTWDTYRLKGTAGRLFNLPPLKTKLIWETGELDRVDGGGGVAVDDDDDESSNSNSNSAPPSPSSPSSPTSRKQGRRDERDKIKGGDGVGGRGGKRDKETATASANGRWKKREIELEDGMREVGFWIEGREARVRVEVREGYR